MNGPQLTTDKRSWASLWRTNPITMGFAALGFLAVAAFATTVLLNKAGLILNVK